MASRALPDLVARIRVDSTGVDAAAAGLIGSFGKANLALAGLAAGIGIIIVGSKSMLDIWRAEVKANNDLSQAVAAYNSDLGKTVPKHKELVAGSIQARASAAELARAHDAVRLATIRVAEAQERYNHDVYMYGVNNTQTINAKLALESANVRLSAAERRLADDTGLSSGKFVTVAATHRRAAIDLAAYQKQIENFIKANSSFISDQAEVVNNYAKATRSGLDLKETQRVLNDALDLSALKHITLSDATDVLIAAEHGRMRGLIDLGVTTTKFTDANGNLIKSQHSVAQAMAEVDAKVKGGRNTLDDVDKKWNDLKNHWQDLSKVGGPVIFTLLDTVVTKLDDVYNALDRIGKDDALWARISGRLTDWAQQIRNFFESSGLANIIGTGVADFLVWLITGNAFGGTAGSPTTKGGITLAPPPGGPTQKAGRAGGGPVVPGGIYTVGEGGPETLFMGAHGGYVVPGSGGGGMTVIVNVAGSVQTERGIVLAVREGIRRLDREGR